ncbi:MAG: DUF1501 domain-containing protein [Pirellulaceae bacterium]
MFRVLGSPAKLCDGLGRRDFLRIGSLGAFGLALPELFSQQSTAAEQRGSFGRAKRCMFIFLTGGPPQVDLWDMKPAAPVEIRGELRPISTNVAGMQISELLPNLAKVADKFCILRSLTHRDTVHTSAGYTLLTGNDHPLANAKTATDIKPRPDDHPHLGSLLALARPSTDGTPAFVSLPEVIKDAAVNEFPGQVGGFLGRGLDPFRIETAPDKLTFRLPDIVLPKELTAARLAERRLLQTAFNNSLNITDQRAATVDLDANYARALDLLRSPRVQKAFDLAAEPAPIRAAYGQHLFGQGCLLGRRLLEAGVALVTVYWHYEGPDDSPVWDTHENNFPHLRNRLVPPADAAIAAVLRDLSDRGLLEETLVVVLGEFGRSPKVNGKGGRDHWPHAQSILLAGAGIAGGSIYGSTDAQGGYPATCPVTPRDLTATLLHLLGVSPDLTIRDRAGRPYRACEGTPIGGLIS